MHLAWELPYIHPNMVRQKSRKEGDLVFIKGFVSALGRPDALKVSNS